MLFGTLAFCVAAIYNGYPLLYPDSIPYVDGYTPPMRAPGYGWITAPLRLFDSLWPYVVLHSLIVAHLIYLIARTQTQAVPFWRFMLLILLLAAGTTLPWFTGFIMADIFTGVMTLSFYLMLFRWHGLSLPEQCYLPVLFAAACTAHLLNCVVAASLFLVIVFLRLIGRARTPWPRIGLVFTLTIAAVVALFLHTRVNYGVWAPTAGGYVFPLARLAANGQLKDYLDESCGQKKYAICPYRNDLPKTADEFIWHSEVPFKLLGGFLGYRSEGSTLVVNTISAQPYRTILESLDQARETMQGFHLRYIYFNQRGTWVDDAIRKRFPLETTQLASARQNTGKLDLSVLDKVHRTILFVCLGMSVLLVVCRFTGLPWPSHVSVELIVLVMAALIMVGLSLGIFGHQPSERYMARVIWLLPTAAFTGLLFGREFGVQVGND